MKEIWHKHIKYPLKEIVQKPWLNSLLSVLLGMYYGTLDIWGDDWSWVSNHKDIHGYIYSGLLVITIISVSLKSYFDYSDEKSYNQSRETLNKFISMLRKIVKAKRDRFHSKVSAIKTTKNKPNFFNHITIPDEQLEYIMRETQIFFEHWGISKDKLDITIIWSKTKKGENPAWKYALQLDKQRQHTQPSQLMANNSLAKKAIETGEAMFLADLNAGINKQIFFSSKRAKDNENVGSIYCKPVTITIQDITYKYVFSLVSYGKYLCIPSDELEASYVKHILDEIGDRVELELYLHAMKNHTLK